MEKTLLITGFEPFGGQSINPSWEAVQALPERIGEYRLHKLLIPVEYEAAPRRILEEASVCQPQVILAVGQAGGRDGVTPEVIGINLREAAIADNAGRLCRGEPILRSGPDGCFATVPVRAMAEAIRDKGIPAKLSYSAGAYVCNDVLYTLAHHYRGTSVRVGFIHVPYLPQQGEPSLPLSHISDALNAAIAAMG